MLMITKEVTTEYVHTQTDFSDFFPKLQLLALKYETPMYQEFRTQNTCLVDNCFISYLGLCVCFIFK